MESSYKDFLKFLKDSLESNTLQQSKLFTRKKVFLDESFSINDEDARNQFSSPFRGFWVVDASDKDFKVNMAPNVANNYGDKLTLKFNMIFDFGELLNGCKFEFSAQSGKWIEVIFFHKGVPNLGLTEIGDVSLKSETLIDSEVVEVTNDKIQISTVSENNKKVTVSNIGATPIFIGSESNVDSIDYENTCMFLSTGNEITIDGSKQLSCKTFSGTTQVRVKKEK